MLDPVDGRRRKHFNTLLFFICVLLGFLAKFLLGLAL
jgi:hypothetical protein